MMHHVAQGQHDYTPGHPRNFGRASDGFTLTLVFDAASWFDPTPEGPLGKDGKDWNKAGGVTTCFPSGWANNHCAALVGFRPGEQPGTWEIAAYVNDRRGGHKAERLITVPSGVETTVTVALSAKEATYAIPGRSVTLPFDRQCFQWNVGPWFGGTLPAPFTATLTATQS